MEPKERNRLLVHIGLLVGSVVAVFTSGLLPFEQVLRLASLQTASVVPADIVSLTNERRTEDGEQPLMVSPLLTQAAQNKANDMAENSYYAHVGPDGKTPLDWLKGVGYKYLNAGENLVIDRKTSEEAIDAWMNSPEHRENILRPQFTEIGVGVAKGEYEGVETIFVVQEFGTPYPTAVAYAPRPTPTPTKTLNAPVTTVPTVTVTIPAPVTTPAKPTQTPVQTPVKQIPVVQPTIQPSKLIAPSLTSIAKPLVKSLTVAPATTTPMIIASSTINATTTVSTTTQEVSFTLPPEFFTPVTIQNKIDEPAAPLAKHSNLPSWLEWVRTSAEKIIASIPSVH